MSRSSRAVAIGYPHHVTQRGNNRDTVFLDDQDRNFYLEKLKKYTEQYNKLKAENERLKGVLKAEKERSAAYFDRLQTIERKTLQRAAEIVSNESNLMLAEQAILAEIKDD